MIFCRYNAYYYIYTPGPGDKSWLFLKRDAPILKLGFLLGNITFTLKFLDSYFISIKLASDKSILSLNLFYVELKPGCIYLAFT